MLASLHSRGSIDEAASYSRSHALDFAYSETSRRRALGDTEGWESCDGKPRPPTSDGLGGGGGNRRNVFGQQANAQGEAKKGNGFQKMWEFPSWRSG